jgi:hypothetical protein
MLKTEAIEKRLQTEAIEANEATLIILSSVKNPPKLHQLQIEKKLFGQRLHFFRVGISVWVCWKALSFSALDCV